MENLQAYFGASPSVNELMTPDPRIQGGACRTLRLMAIRIQPGLSAYSFDCVRGNTVELVLFG